MENLNPELLTITINQNETFGIRRLVGTTRWIFILGMLICGIYIIDAALRASYMHPERYLLINKVAYWEIKLHTWYLLLYSCLFVSQLIYYLRFIKDLNKGLDLLDSERFNHAFERLYTSNVLAIIHMALSILLGILNVWMNYDLSRMARAQ